MQPKVIIRFIIILVAFLFPVFIFAENCGPASINTTNCGYKSIKNGTIKVQWADLPPEFIINTSDKDYFIPTRTISEYFLFMNNKPSGLSFANTCGDGVCDSPYENCQTCSNDCGYCSCDQATTCAALSQNGAIGGACGYFKPDNCSNFIDCGVSPQTGNYCKLPQGTDSDYYLYQKGFGSNIEFLYRSCNSAPNYTYQKKCWDRDISRSLVVRQGDKAQNTKCALSYSVEDPVCTTNTDPSCPSDCPTKTYNGTISNDACSVWDYGLWFEKDYYQRKKWTCSYSSGVTRWYYGDTCSSYETISDSGNCGACTPNCSGKTCGQSDGCGGTCTACSSYEACVSGTCKYITQLRFSVDDEYEAYLVDSNNNQLETMYGNSWTEIGERTTILGPGNYLLAIKAHNVSHGAGIAASVEIGSKAINTTKNNEWICSTSRYGCTMSPYDFTRYDLNVSCEVWDTAKNMSNSGPTSGNQLPYRQIWAQDTSTADAYCRLKFSIP